MKFTKKQLQRIIKEELTVAQLGIISENPAMLTKYLPMIQDLGPQIQNLGPAIEQYGPMMMQLISMVKDLDDDKLEQVMGLIGQVGQLGQDD